MDCNSALYPDFGIWDGIHIVFNSIRQKICLNCNQIGKTCVYINESSSEGSETMTDEKILRWLQDGRQDAMTDLMDKYDRYVHSVIAGMIGGAGRSEDIEELVQDVFYSVWNHAGSIEKRKLKAYLGTTARNKAKNYLRGKRDIPMALDSVELPDPTGSLEDLAVQEELSRSIRRALHRMGPRDSEIFLRHYYYLQTAETISEQMGIPRSTVLSRLSRGRKTLQKIMNKEGLF